MLKPDVENVRSTDTEATISRREGSLMKFVDTVSAVGTNDVPKSGRSYRDVVTSGGVYIERTLTNSRYIS